MALDPVLVEKVAQALYEREGWAKRRPWRSVPHKNRKPFLADAETAIRVVFGELGLKEERQPYHFGSGSPDHPWQTGCRLVSEWRPVEQGDVDGD